MMTTLGNLNEHGVNVNANSLYPGVLNTNVARNGGFFELPVILAAVNKNEKQQLQRLLDACKGIPRNVVGSDISKHVMAMEMAIHNIRVNTICHGIFKSEITEGLMQKKWITRVAQRTVPLRTCRTVDPALTNLERYLIHDSSRHITGSVFIVASFGYLKMVLEVILQHDLVSMVTSY
ncbi:putative NAD(P)-binding Rossmann-fold superfamily protein [Tanacetum coccineum]